MSQNIANLLFYWVGGTHPLLNTHSTFLLVVARHTLSKTHTEHTHRGQTPKQANNARCAHNARSWPLHHKTPLHDVAQKKDQNRQDLFLAIFQENQKTAKDAGDLTKNLPWLKTIILKPSPPCIPSKTNTCAKFVHILDVISNTTFCSS